MLQDIKISRFEEDPQAQGVIRPEDGRWQLVIDKDGFPHLYLQVNIDQDEDGQVLKGMFCLDDMLPKHVSIRDLMEGGTFGGRLAPEEEEAAFQEYLEDRERRQIPCPRY